MELSSAGNSFVLEARMKLMRDRFNNLLVEDSALEAGLSRSATNSGPLSNSADFLDSSNPLQSKKATALARWDKVKRTVLGDRQQLRVDNNSFSSQMSSVISDENHNSILTSALTESDILLQFWDDLSVPRPLVPDFPEDIDYDLLSREPCSGQLEQSILHDSEKVQIIVNHIDENDLLLRKKLIEESVLQQKSFLLEHEKLKSIDVIWRENLARERILDMEEEAKKRIAIERAKLEADKLSREKKIAIQFRLAREKLENSIRSQNSMILEKYGDMIASEQSLSRKFYVRSIKFPQPIEVRIHLLRAIKTKLPKGAYLLMLTQYESLGGSPLAWSKAGLYGIGDSKPAVTRPVKHYGRYFDRTLRVEDSCFALCPPTSQLKPSYVLVLELFQLANRHCPIDRVVAWSAMPMCSESMGHVEGKFKLPMLRGEHTPSLRHFCKMESAISTDLNNWLCNIYFEIKHLSLSDIEKNEKEAQYLRYDYINKSVDVEPMQSAVRKAAVGDFSIDHGLFKRKHRSHEDIVFNDENCLQHLESSRSSGNMNGKKLSGDSSKPPIRQFLSGMVSLLSFSDSSRSKISSKEIPTDEYRMENGPSIPINSESESKPLLSKSILDTKRVKKSFQAQENPGSHKVAVFDDEVEFSDDEQIESSDNNAGSSRIKGVVERGYRPQDEFYLDGEQRGRLQGIDSIQDSEARKWAMGSLEEGGAVTRRWQSEGPRFDSEATNPDNKMKPLLKKFSDIALNEHVILSPTQRSDNRSPVAYVQEMTSKDDFGKIEIESNWSILESPDEMELFTPAIAADPSQRKRQLPGAIAKSKLKYLYSETFGELSYFMWGTFDFYLTLVVYIVALWFRMYIHFLGQYLYLMVRINLKALTTPVYGFGFELHQVKFKYMSSSISIGSEIGVVAVGPLSNIAIFAVFALFAKVFYKFAGFLPKGVSQFTAAYGVAVIIDPLLIAIVDLANHNFNCVASSPACKLSYTSSACSCFTGDFAKLWVRTAVEEGSGLTGLLLLIIIYGACIVISSLFLYEYLVYVHHDGRILDIWRRIHGQAEEFLLPDDFEISKEELHSICRRASQWRGSDGKIRKLIVSEYVERDPLDKTFQEITKHYAIYEKGTDKSSIYRHFLILPNGAVIEIFDQFANVQSSKFQALHKLLNIDNSIPVLNNLESKDNPSSLMARAVSGQSSSNIFAGIENM